MVKLCWRGLPQIEVAMIEVDVPVGGKPVLVDVNNTSLLWITGDREIWIFVV